MQRMSENPLVNLAGILFPRIGLIKILRRGIHQSTYYSRPRDYYALLSGLMQPPLSGLAVIRARSLLVTSRDETSSSRTSGLLLMYYTLK